MCPRLLISGVRNHRRAVSPAGAPQWGPPTGGQPGGVPQWGPPPGPPQRRGGKGKWIFGGIALLAVIAVTVVITVLVVGKDSGGGSPTPTNGNGSDFASANDKGPVGIITEEPTCDAWGRIADEYSCSNKGRQLGVTGINRYRRTAWTPDQRAMYEAVGKAMTQRRRSNGQFGEVDTASGNARTLRAIHRLCAMHYRTLSPRTPPKDRYLAGGNRWRELGISGDMFCDRLPVGATHGAVDSRSAPPTKISPSWDPAKPAAISRRKADPSARSGPRYWTSLFADTAAWREIDPNNPSRLSGPPKRRQSTMQSRR